MEVLEKQACPFCKAKALTLAQDEQDIPYFGKVFLFSMTCSSCKAHHADVEAAEQKEPCKITFDMKNEKDLSVRVVKSSAATLKIPNLRLSVTPGPGSDGYVSNIEGVLTRFENAIETQRDLAEEEEDKTAAKNLLKKIRKVKFGDIPIKIIIEDPTGNSAIISDRAVVEKLKGKKE